MTHFVDIPTIFLLEGDVGLRGALARGLRFDGMGVVEFEGADEALGAITEGARPEVLVIAAESDGVIASELARQVRTLSPQTQVVFTLGSRGDPEIPPGRHALVKPFEPSKLSRFIRLVIAKPALRSTLQMLYRRARSTSSEVAS